MQIFAIGKIFLPAGYFLKNMAFIIYVRIQEEETRIKKRLSLLFKSKVIKFLPNSKIPTQFYYFREHFGYNKSLANTYITSWWSDMYKQWVIKQKMQNFNELNIDSYYNSVANFPQKNSMQT